EILDQDVARRRQSPGQLLPRLLGEVDGDAALRAVEGQEHGAAAVALGRAGAGLVAGDRVFDLDDVGAQVSELLRAQRAGDDAREIEHANTLERWPPPDGVSS